ncbi:DUF998 domain-containing protein [Amycolatopsis sp. CA-230715]|uniref:DUF998 domain-containing protein n=1 Tax=Amycolatopsis sp. CA-230715 TaxID=2745196 RepID=UPI0020B1F496|nr:DUF998 domain-containing protein [Amycolatopsis sp. CA-230715]
MGQMRAQVAGNVNAARARVWVAVSAATMAWGAFTMLLMHAVSNRDPLFDTLSSYVISGQGAAMLASSILALAVSSIALLGALLSCGIGASRTCVALFAIWTTGLTLAAIFPASWPERPDPVSGQIHQYACLFAFLSLPGIGFAVLERVPDARIRKLTFLSVGTLALFGLSYLFNALRDVPDVSDLSAMLPVGVMQRLTLAVDLALLCGLLLHAYRIVTIRNDIVAGQQVVTEQAGDRTSPPAG